jgi:hypothetical protein
MHNFTIDYTDGLKIDNSFYDLEFASGKESHYMVKTYFLHKKIKRSLQTYPDQLGITATIEELETKSDKTLLTANNCNLGCWIVPSFTKFFVPYHVEIYYNNELYITDTLDCKFKLVNFNLYPKNERELYTWMNVIEKFKRETHCDISIKNDIVASTTEFDNIVDVKYKIEDTNKQYYLGLNVGRFYQPNSSMPDINYHPDQLHNKNSLDIINDILYHYTTII